jgi:hypothetical protein
MPNHKPDAERALHKLGKRLREGWAQKHPIPEQSLETVRNAVREEWVQEQTAERERKPAPDAAKDQQREPPEPDMER